MRELFEDEPRPRWILIVNGHDSEIRRQTNELLTHPKHLLDRDLVVLAICSDQVAVVHGDCSCHTKASDLAEKYGFSLDHFSSALIKDDCVKWAAPEPVCFKDLISVIDEMPLRELENAVRGPAPVN